MDPIPANALAVQWEFRCHRHELAEKPWRWVCRSRDGVLVARSAEMFDSLKDAVADANRHGFVYEAQRSAE